jgi:hypothetical protein
MKGYQMLKHCCCCLICCLLLLPELACMNGPIRYKTVGYRKYISINPEHAWMIMALPADVVISAADFVAIPIVAIPVTLFKGGPDGQGLLMPWWGFITFPLWYPVTIYAYNAYGPDIYRQTLGAEAGKMNADDATTTGPTARDFPQPL